VSDARPPGSSVASARAALRDAVPAAELAVGDPVTVALVAAADLEAAAHAMAGTGARLADLFAAEERDEILLRLVYALDREGGYVVLTSPAPATGEYAALSDIAPAAFTEECEIFEQYGIRPAGGKPLNRVVLPPHADSAFPLRAGRRVAEPANVHAPHHVRGQAFEFPFGPVRAAGWESLYMGLVTTGEEVLDLYLFHWHKHRGIERRLAGMPPDRALFLVERADGLSAVGNGLAFCHAIESAAGIAPSPAAAATRAIALELERIYNHAAAIAMLCQTTGLSVGQAQAEIALERLLRLNLATFGHRYLFDVLAIGGVRRGPRAGLAPALADACDELAGVVGALRATNSHVDRLEATGMVTNEAARRLSLVGPLARSAGYDIDARRDHSRPPYDRLGVRVAVQADGDVLARVGVFIDEIAESRRLIDALAADAGDLADGYRAVAGGSGSALGWAESARGESLAWVDLGEDGCLRRVRLRPAGVRNWRAFDDAVRAQNVFTDVPIIEASFWLTVAGFAR
jgi:Ni,Fe-hydrogenase III large subunit/Ni,Fe-hydrogenase III component G